MRPFLCGSAENKSPSLQECHYEVNHQFFFLRLRFRNHHRKCDKRMVGDAFGAVFTQKKSVALEEIKEQSGGNSLVAVRKTMILRDEI